IKHSRKAKLLINLIRCRITGKKITLYTSIALTSRCNYKCVYCYGDYSHREKDEFSTEELTDIIPRLKKMGTQVINLTGGEPLLRGDIQQLIRTCKANNLLCHISTNAALIEKKILQIKEADEILTSLDGLEEINDKSRGKGTFQATLNGIRCALENGIKTNVNMVLTKYNPGDVEPLLELAVKTGFSMTFNIVYESNSSSHPNYEETVRMKNRDSDAIRKALETIIAYKKKGYPVR
ncbi:MAG: radical SAM protein, partial [bacterium]|nr:radical SAM protein [bacterium]